MPQISWQTVFRPEFSNGGIDALTRGVNARLFDDFESYTNDAALQAVWSVVNGAVGDPTLTSAANAVRGRQSAQITATGGAGTLRRAIPNSTFGFPASGRIRYISFKGVVTTGTSAIRVRISDASDATLYKEWAFTLSTDKTVDYIIDLYSGSTGAIGGGGFLNTESYPGPVDEGATAWNPNLIDRFEFRSLTQNSVFRFDDIRFYYEYSLLDALGFGTEPATDDGADGSVHSKIRKISLQVQQLVGTTEQYSKAGPAVAYLNNTYTFGLELKGVSEQGIPSTTEISPGNYTIDRVRGGTTTAIVASTPATEAAGFISVSYTFLEDNWQPGDQVIVTFSGGFVNNDTDTVVTPNNVAAAQAVVTFPTVGDAYLFQAGQRVRLYDDDATEWNTVLTVDSPTQLTLSAVAANLYDASPRIVLVEHTDLETARIVANITRETEIQRELQQYVLADYDDFTSADADANTARWDPEYIAESDGSAAGAEGGTADINTTTAGQARVRVDPDATPTRAAYAISRHTAFQSRWMATAVDATVSLTGGVATSSYVGLRISNGPNDDANNFILVARERSNAVNRITANARFGGGAVTTVVATVTDNALAFKIERYDNVWNVFYSLTQYPNWNWVKLTQFEDAAGNFGSQTTVYLYSESAPADAEITTADFDNWRFYVNAGAFEQLIGSNLNVLASGEFTTSSATVPADTDRGEANDYWNGTLLVPVTGVAAFQPRVVVDFVNVGGVFTIDAQNPFTTAPAVGDQYVILAYQYPLIPAADATSNQTSAHVVGGKADTAQYDGTNTASSIVRLLRAVHRGEILASGTFTTSSATVPADTGRAEANDYWNGCWVMSVAGAVAFQPRLITDFANAGGVFTVDAEQPLTAAPGLVAYVILSPNSQLVPAANSTANATPAHVVGNKTDAIPAMNLAPGNDSLAAHAKAILERIGATPADPDDSVLTNLGQRDDAATADTLADITTTSIEAKLRLILNRLSTDAFTATIQGGARVALDTMLEQLATYFSAAGAAWSVQINGLAIRTNLEQVLEDLAAVLGADGANVFNPSIGGVARTDLDAALAALGIALGAEYDGTPDIYDTVVTGQDSSAIAANADGSVEERLEDLRLAASRAEYQLADYDDFDVADADANTERWDTSYINGAEGGSANINTTTAGQLRVAVDPDATPTAAGYAVQLAQPVVSKYFMATVDLDVSSFGTPNASWATLGMRVSAPTYDANNVVYCQRQESSGGVLNRIAVGAIFNGVQQGEQYFTTADTTVGFKIERLDNVWRCYYSLSQYPDYVWVLLAQFEDPSEFMDGRLSVYLDAYSPGNADAQTAIGDFDNFKLYVGLNGVAQAVAGDYDSSAVTEDGDGSALERLEELRGTTSTGTFTLTAAMGTAEQTVTNYTPIRPGRMAILLDLNTLVAAVEGGTVIVRLKLMIDGATLRTIDRADFLVGTDEVHPTVSGFVVEGASFVRITVQANSAVGANRNIPWRIVEAA